MQTPCARKNCQYCVQNDVAKVPATTSTEPVAKRGRKNPASVKRPVKVPMKKSRKISNEPIQEMSDGARFRVDV